MLLARRQLVSRHSLSLRSSLPLACTCQPRIRLSSTSTSLSSSDSTTPIPSSSSAPPPLRRTTSSPIYTVPPLPPLPPPLPSDVGSYAQAQAPTSILVNAPANHEQLAVLNACLASGDITRSEDVAKRIRTAWIRNRGDLPNRGLATLLPSRVHADFLRAYLSSALVAATPVPVSSINAFASTSSSSSSKQSRMFPVSRARFFHKAWLYFDSLLAEQWLPESGPRINQALDISVFATMFKGITAGGPHAYNPSQLTDVENWQRPITHLLPHLEKMNISLLDVLQDPIFETNLPSYIGTVTRFQVLDAIVETGKGRSGWNDWAAVVSSVRDTLTRIEEGRIAGAVERAQATELDPTKSKDDITISLQTLRTNLSTLGFPDSPTALTPTARQRLLEESSYDAARQLYIHEMEELAKVGKDKERGMQSNWLQGVMFDWMKLLQENLETASKAKGKQSPWGRESDIEPFLRLLSPDKMALITIVELLRLCGGGGVSDGMKAARAILHIGKAIENEYHAQVLKESIPNKELEKALERISEEGQLKADGETITLGMERTVNIMWRREMAKREKEGDSTWRPAWSQGIRAKVGSILVTALMEVAKVERRGKHPVTGESISEIQPAFSHAYQYVRGLKLGVIKVNPVVAERMDSDPLRITLHPRFLPMVVTPKPWLSWNSGSYLVHGTQMMRTKDSDEQVAYLQQADDAGTLDNIFTGLDVLGSLSWKINRKVFDVVSEVWNTGEALADIPPKDSLNQPLEALKPENVETDPRAKDTYRHRVRQALQERRAAHSNRCDVNYKLEIGRAFLEETFYFPHNLDFRGRAYPIPPNLSHIGNDMCRGILQFAEAKPLGVRGLRWLKIHLANMTGFDKASFEEREAYAMEHLEDVYDSADNPLGGKRWWLKAEDPWQCLATCIELAAAVRAPVPIEYECALPVHQDGTCNGLQHYAALGGDLKGANQVNLEGGDRPADVYSGVAAMANEVIDKEAKEGNLYATLLQGKVNRKVVKQTVMTTVYGVTFIGAKKQIEKQLKERGDIPAEHLYNASLYLGKIVLDSIGDVFKGATAIQTWLNRSARLIAKSIPPGRIEAAFEAQQECNSKSLGLTKSTVINKRMKDSLSRIPKEQMTSVVWTTPLGLPVVQPYRKPRKRQVATALQTIFISDPSIPAEVDPRAQATAFPPNFIHSLDATHMMMTALACKDKIAFASVHDSYWTHACSVDEMSVTLRDTFIELHSQDILGKLREEFITRYAGHVVPVSKVPKGMSYSSPLDGEHGVASETSPLDLFNALESEDGDKILPLFDASTKRVIRARSPDTEEAGEEDEVDDAKKIASFWSSSSSRSVGSKIVLLSDILPPVPAKGTFDLEKIRDSLYFFS